MTLWETPGGFQDALDAVGRSWKLPLESRTAREGPNTTPVVCFVAPGCFQDAPGRSNVTPVVFFAALGGRWGPPMLAATGSQDPTKAYFSSFFSLSNEFSF